MWRSAFDLSGKNTPKVLDFNEQIEKIYQMIEPLYKNLHAYMRRQIAGIYGNPTGLSKNGPIPAHLFGGIEISDYTRQSRNKISSDVCASDSIKEGHANRVLLPGSAMIKRIRRKKDYSVYVGTATAKGVLLMPPSNVF
ncbi:unnamed protein product [Cylicostephanus goldi]|uniref:Angiotensin-converting enzyme n=1 Tax=Cylicostephanus goldi TaxID=71465 RepID=A0A3P6SAD9_CYLGO|nr:unnamed protein product [Cylicostephanus goldi]